ncbi:M23 family metallopeptidase [Sporosarcina sp. Sa2YVA2]|uniref:M23 family metallopeptidase n=2 Tax=Sporosarcina quadrami TaxID=2762234 RepID=A0ABR8UE45_9BACL|nr:M23 family metallopeptidase [Sporosarcina quadrami]
MVLAIQVVLPAVFLFTLWRANFKSKLEWILDAVATTLFAAWLFQAGNWSWIGYYFRYLLVVILIVALILSWRKMRELPLKVDYSSKQKMPMGVSVFLAAVFGAYNVFAFTGYTTNETALELAFPLKEGTYFIGQGGNSTMLNYHHSYEPQQYALDILKVNQFGIRANGLYPKELTKYHIYEDDLFSPCNGKVVEMENGLPDFAPPEADPENATGNYVALTCETSDAVVYLAHMQKGSVTVEVGELVEVGQKIGMVGNSGNTTEPHLHIHAEKDGVGIPLRFDGKFLVRNQLVR